MFEKTLWVTKPVSEFLFDDYADPFLSIASKLPGLSSLQASVDRFGFFYGTNDSATLPGIFSVETGTDDVTKRGILRNWNYKNSTSYDVECGGVRGSAGDFFPPVQTKHTTLEQFIPGICR
jgi:hypothetical protein